MWGLKLMLGFFPCPNICPNHLLYFTFYFIVTLYPFDFLLVASTPETKFSDPESRMCL